MKPPVPGRFVLGWTGVALICESLRWAYGLGVTPRLGLEWNTPLWWIEFVLYAAAICFGEAFCQSRLLRRFGRPVPPWTAVVGAGMWALSILYTLAYCAFMQAGGLAFDAWMFVASEVSEETAWALVSSVIMTTAVWGRRWEGPWMLWITARTGVALAAGVAAATMPFAFFLAGSRLDYTLVEALQQVMPVGVVGAATPWLLWRFVLPHPAPDPARG